MPKKRKDTEYLSISARIRVMENRLLTKNRMERMLEARTDEETAKVLSECGYGELTDLTPTAVDAAMVRARDALCRDLEQAVPDRRLVELFSRSNMTIITPKCCSKQRPPAQNRTASSPAAAGTTPGNWKQMWRRGRWTATPPPSAPR